MKKIIRNISAALLATSLLLAASCTKEKINDVHGQLNGVDRDNVVDITMPYNMTNGMDEIVVTKAGNEEALDSQLSSVLVLVYEALDENNPNLNKFVYSRFFSAPGSSNEGWVTTNAEKTQGTMTLPCPTGNVFIYLVANWTNTFIDYAEGIPAEELSTHEMPQTQAELFARFIPKWKGNIHMVDGLIPMIATVNNKSGLCKVSVKNGKGEISYLDNNGQQQIIATDGKNYTEQNSFNFRRLMAKITMNFDVAPNGSTDKPNTNATFIPTKYNFRNVASYVAPTSTAWLENDPHLDEVKNTGFQNFSTQSANSFTVYIPENIETCNKEITGYPERERMEKAADGKNSIYSDGPLKGQFRFANAPEYSTYVEVIGKYKDPDNEIIDADTRFFIHLGHFSKQMNDFNVLRDHHYTFNVKVKGVNDIIVESQDNQDKDKFPEDQYYEKNPGVDGLVFRGGLRAYCDAHYDQVELRLRKSEIQDSTIIFAFTPYGTKSGIYFPKGSIIKGSKPLATRQKGEFIPLAANTTFDNIKQYLSWVEIKKQSRNTPGQLAVYCDEKTVNKRKNIFDILDEVCSQENENKYFYYTTFIDEYYYTNTPEGVPARISEFVNKGDRSFALGKTMYTSKDRQSVTVDAIYLIYQKSIATFYDLNDKTQKKFGVESISETEKLNRYNADSQNQSDFWNGRQNTLDEITYKSGIVNWAKNGWLIANKDGKDILVDQRKGRLANTQVACAACLTRNRDFNGDGEIDNTELRWYNPALNQVLGLWIGESALPTTAALYTKKLDESWTRLPWSISNDAETGIYTSNGGNYRVLWAEEGASFGPEGQADREGAEIRAVRNLAADVTTADDWNTSGEVQDYYYFRMDENSRVVELLLNDITLRAFSPGELAPHTERSTINRPCRFFQLADHAMLYDNGNAIVTGARQAKGEIVTDAKNYKGSENVPAGKTVGDWRLPNQRELALLFVIDNHFYVKSGLNDNAYRGGTNVSKLHCRTTFTLNSGLSGAPYYVGVPHTYKQYGFYYNVDAGKLDCDEDGGDNARYFCVRDVQ